MVKCVFCGKETDSFRGVHYIKNDGSVDFYCSSKCRKNSLKLGRDRRKVRWTEAFRNVREKDRNSEKAKTEARKQK